MSVPESLSRHVAAHLRTAAPDVVAHWVAILTARLHTSPQRVLPGDSILNHMPIILGAVADFVAGDIDRPIEEHVRDDLIRLADLRRSQGFDIDELLVEFTDLSRLMRDEVAIAVEGYDGEASLEETVQVVGEVVETIHLLGTVTAARFRTWHARDQKERSRLLGSYTAMLSHELGSRLGAAETALLLILEAEDPPSTERLRGLHELSLQSIRSGLDTVQGVRALFAVQDPESSVGSSDYPLGTLVRDIVHQVRIGAALRGVKIELASDDFDGTVDGERFPLAFYNLLNNAVRHHDLPDGTGTVRVAVSRVDGELHITVADDGPGLGDGVRDRLFSPDIREPSAEHPGLGLAIAWEAVRQMQGDLHVDPPNGRGTTFRIRVPVSPESSPAS